MKKLLFICNPRSGKEQIRLKMLDILNIFVKQGYEVSVHVTQAPRDAFAAAKERASRNERVICSGGDGTLNEVVSGLMELPPEERPALGYIPSGSTNDYASSLGLSKKMKKAAFDAVTGFPFAVDVGQFAADEKKYFTYVAAFGAFTEVSYSTSQEVKNVLGHQAYLLEAIKRISNLKSYSMRFEWEDGVLEDEFILGMVTNTTSIGGFKGLVGKDVELDDGEFEVLLVRRPRTPKDLAAIASYLILKEGENECVIQFRVKKLAITAKEKIDWTLDGEFGGSFESVTIQNLRRAVQICRKKEEAVEAESLPSRISRTFLEKQPENC